MMSGFRRSVNNWISEHRLRRVGTSLCTLESNRGGRKLLGNNPRLSFSQFGEDAVLQAIIPETIGRYVDVGSGDPIRGSNTFALYLQGWRGYCIDPILTNVRRTQILRPGDVAIHAAVSSTPDSVVFHEFDPYEYSTTSDQRAEELKAQGMAFVGTYEVKPIKLSELSFGEPCFTVMSVDVEGMELDVLSTIDWDVFSPEVLVLEDWADPLQSSTELREFVECRGYRLIGVTGVSSIYRRTEA
jgi:FkbM family methyltransferase